jgi:hypothetical protein
MSCTCPLHQLGCQERRYFSQFHNSSFLLPEGKTYSDFQLLAVKGGDKVVNTIRLQNDAQGTERCDDDSARKDGFPAAPPSSQTTPSASSDALQKNVHENDLSSPFHLNLEI